MFGRFARNYGRRLLLSAVIPLSHKTNTTIHTNNTNTTIDTNDTNNIKHIQPNPYLLKPHVDIQPDDTQDNNVKRVNIAGIYMMVSMSIIILFIMVILYK
jgi:hypothetical protein